MFIQRADSHLGLCRHRARYHEPAFAQFYPPLFGASNYLVATAPQTNLKRPATWRLANSSTPTGQDHTTRTATYAGPRGACCNAARRGGTNRVVRWFRHAIQSPTTDVAR